MPRASRPKFKLPAYTLTPFCLNSSTIDQLAEQLAVASDKTKVSAMAACVQFNIDTYCHRVHAFEHGPTAKSLLREIGPIHKKIEKLYQQSPIFEKLYSASHAINNVLRKNAVPLKKSPKRSKYPLRLAVTDLFFTFHTFNQSKSAKWQPFVSLVLTAAGIKHPDPDEHRARFNVLLDLPLTKEETR